MKKSLLDDVREFLAETGMGEYRFGYKSCKNGRLLEQLEGRVPSRSGDVRAPSKFGHVRPETEAKIRAFMRGERARLRAEKRASRSTKPSASAAA